MNNEAWKEYKAKRDSKIRELRRQGKTLASIGKQFDLSRERVRQLTKDVHR